MNSSGVRAWYSTSLDEEQSVRMRATLDGLGGPVSSGPSMMLA